MSVHLLIGSHDFHQIFGLFVDIDAKLMFSGKLCLGERFLAQLRDVDLSPTSCLPLPIHIHVCIYIYMIRIYDPYNIVSPVIHLRAPRSFLPGLIPACSPWLLGL